MHSMVLWPFLTLVGAAIAFAPTIENSANRAIIYWLVIPPLVAGALAAWSHFGVR
jgi:hypothetical protein